MNAREFLALSDHLAGFQTAMSGALKKEADEARAAIRELDNAHNLTKLEGELKAREETFAANKADVEATLNELKDSLDLKEEVLNEKESALDQREAELNDVAAKNREIIAQAEDVTEQHAREEALLAAQRSQNASEAQEWRVELDIREGNITAREEALERKLEALKEIA
jgi:chromosome segregation ATPase